MGIVKLSDLKMVKIVGGEFILEGSEKKCG